MQARIDELEAASASLLSENTKLKAKIDAQSATLDKVRADAMDSIVANHRDRIAPASLASIDLFKAKCDDVAEFGEFVASLATVTRPAPVGDGGPVNEPEPAPALTEGQAALIKAFGIKAETFAAADDVELNYNTEEVAQ
jgi:hypothetical protein